MGRKRKKPVKPLCWCWYCNREFDDEKILIQHQKAKHFKCHICFRKLFTGPGLAIHCLQVHKHTISEVPNAIPSRNSVEVEIYGMEGVPDLDRLGHGGNKQESDDNSKRLNNSVPGMSGIPPMQGMMPGMQPMHGMMPGLGYGHPTMPGNPMGHIGNSPYGMPPNYMSPNGAMLMVRNMPSMMPPSTIASTISAPSKPLFPAAVAQSLDKRIKGASLYLNFATAAQRETFENLDNVNKRKYLESFQKFCKKEKQDRKKKTVDLEALLQGLPKNQFHLGDLNFVLVSSFYGKTQINFRRYIVDDVNGSMKATKDRVTISPLCWDLLEQKMMDFFIISDDQCLVIQKELCISKWSDGDKKLMCFQRMIEKKNLTLDFSPHRFLIQIEHFQKLLNFSESVSKAIKNVDLQETLQFFVLDEIKKFPQPPNVEGMGDPDRPDGWYDTKDSLFECMSRILVKNINSLFVCFGCKNDLLAQENHECVNETRDSKFEKFYVQAFNNINWKELAIEFVKCNFKFDYFLPLITLCDFFECLEFNETMRKCKELYLKGTASF